MQIVFLIITLKTLTNILTQVEIMCYMRTRMPETT